MNYQAVVCFFVLFLLQGCHSSRKAANSKGMDKPMEKLNILSNEDTTNKIVFLTFSITQTDSSQDKYEIHLISKTLANGILKKHALANTAAPERNSLYCEFSSSDKKTIDVVQVENPLNKIYEFPGDNNGLGKAVIRSQAGKFNIRFQYNSSIKYLSIFKPSNDVAKTLQQIYYAAL